MPSSEARAVTLPSKTQLSMLMSTSLKALREPAALIAPPYLALLFLNVMFAMLIGWLVLMRNTLAELKSVPSITTSPSPAMESGISLAMVMLFSAYVPSLMITCPVPA